MIHIIQGFQLSTREAVDNRLLLSYAEMENTNDNLMPQKYFTVCKEDGCLYMYDKDREFYKFTPETDAENLHPNQHGKFVKFSSSEIGSITINGQEIPVKGGKLDIPLISKTQYGAGMLGNGLDAKDGVITLDFNSLEDKSIPMKLIDFGQLIIDAND